MVPVAIGLDATSLTRTALLLSSTSGKTEGVIAFTMMALNHLFPNIVLLLQPDYTGSEEPVRAHGVNL
jgi:hypothetical protein